MRILIVEDDRKIADLLTKGLREAGYAVDAVLDGDEGLNYGLGQQLRCRRARSHAADSSTA